MTRNETAQILAILNAAYPAFYGKLKPREFDSIVNLWAEMFEDDDFGLVKYSLKQLISEHTGYPPDIAALKTKIKEVTSTALGEPTHEELWHTLKQATKNGYYGAEKEFEKLPSVLKRYVGSPSMLREYSQIDERTFNTVNHGQFLKQISVIEQREEFEKSMPDDVKRLVTSMVKMIDGATVSQLTEAQVNDRRNEILNKLGL